MGPKSKRPINEMRTILTRKTQAFSIWLMDAIKQAASLLGKRGRERNTEKQKEASRRNGRLSRGPKKIQNSPCITQAPRVISPQ